MTTRILVGGVLAAAAPAGLAAAALVLPADAQETMTAPVPLRAFARVAAEEVERALAAQPAPAAESRGMLLAMRVHLALLLRDGPRALATAEQIRAVQATEAERAFSGLTTRAAVAAWAVPPAEQASAFAVEFRRQLRPLPHRPEMRAVLVRQRERLQAMTAPALHAEAAQLATTLGGRRRVTLAEADLIIRLGHRLENLVPWREAMISALDEAIAARPNG